MRTSGNRHHWTPSWTSRFVHAASSFRHAQKVARSKGYSKTGHAVQTEITSGEQHNAMNKRRIRINLHGKYKHKGFARSQISHQFGGYFTGSSGQQGVDVAMNLLTKDQFLLSPGVGAALPSRDSWPSNPFDLNPNQVFTGGKYSTATVSPLVDSVIIHDIYGNFLLTNFTTSSMEVQVVPILYKVTTNEEVYTIWSGLNIDAANGQSGYSQATGTTNPTPGYPSRYVVGNRPWMHKSFRKQCKVLQKHTYTIEPGVTENIHFSVAVNKLYDKQYLLSMMSGDNFIGGHTISFLIIYKGSPVIATDAAVTYLNKVTLSKTELGVMFDYKVSISYPQRQKVAWLERTDGGYLTTSTALKSINDQDAVQTNQSVV